MSYEYMQGLGSSGMGTDRDEARAAYNAGTAAYTAGRYQEAYDQLSRANRLVPHGQTLYGMAAAMASMGNCTQALVHFREGINTGVVMNPQSREMFYDCLDREGQAPSTTTPATPATPTPATTEEAPGFIDDIGEAFSSLWDKMGGGNQTQIAAEDIAREEGGIAKIEMEPTAIPGVKNGVTSPAVTPPAAPPAAAPPAASVIVDPEPSWAARYAPFMVLGGLGIGAVVVLVLVMRKRG